MQVFSPFATVKRILDEYKKQAENFGYKAPPEQLGWAVPIYVADNDEKAWAGAEPHVDFLFNKLLKRPFQQFFPPGYLTEKSMARVVGDKKIGGMQFDPRKLNEQGMILVGSPSTVRERLADFQKQTNMGLLVALLHFGKMTKEETLENIDLFAKEVMPYFRTQAKVPVA